MNALEIQSLEKKYSRFRLEPFDLTLPSGCILGLVGENGAGKSTTIRLILNLIQKDGGSIRVLGREQDADFYLTMEDVGVVLDEAGFPGCVTAVQINRIMKNIYRSWDEKEYFAHLDWLGLPLDMEFEKYSRGMKMKQAIAVALSHHPKLLILDEPTSGLDPVVRDEVVEMLMEFTREEDHSVLISSHIVSDLEKLCDYIAFIHEGRLLLCEEKDMLLERYGVIHISREQLADLLPEAILGSRGSAYGVEAVVDRAQIPAGFSVSPVTMEDLFVFMIRGKGVQA